ncbi:alanine racemase [Chloroflexota bacterium]
MKSVAVPYASVDTPALLIDLDLWQANIDEISQAAREAGVALRPHVKVHQCPDLAKMQLASGARGVEVGLIDQARVMADAGIEDIIVAHPFYGDHKFRKVEELVSRPNLRLAIVMDMLEQGEALSEIGQRLGKRVPVYLKVDTGIRRYGTLPGMPTLSLARQVNDLPGVQLVGIYAHESPGQTPPTQEGVSRVALEVGSVMCNMARLLRRDGLEIQDVSTGASPTFFETCLWIKQGMLAEITELHPGQRAIGDIVYSHVRGCDVDRITISLLSTVVSTSHSSYAVIDAGFKALGAESMIGRRDAPGFFWNGMPSYGQIRGRDDLWLGRVGAESGFVYYKEDAAPLSLGERLEVIPNSAGLLFNIHDKAYGVRDGQIERQFEIAGRGKGT